MDIEKSTGRLLALDERDSTRQLSGGQERPLIFFPSLRYPPIARQSARQTITPFPSRARCRRRCAKQATPRVKTPAPSTRRILMDLIAALWLAYRKSVTKTVTVSATANTMRIRNDIGNVEYQGFDRKPRTTDTVS